MANRCGYRSNRSCYLSVASYLTRLQLGTKSSHLCRQEAKSIQDVSVAWFYFWHSLGLDALSGRKLFQYEVTLADLHFTVLFMVRTWTWNNKQEKVWQRFTPEIWHWWSGLRGKDWLGDLPWQWQAQLCCGSRLGESCPLMHTTSVCSGSSSSYSLVYHVLQIKRHL